MAATLHAAPGGVLRHFGPDCWSPCLLCDYALPFFCIESFPTGARFCYADEWLGGRGGTADALQAAMHLSMNSQSATHHCHLHDGGKIERTSERLALF